MTKQLPSGWHVVSLGDFVHLQRGYDLPQPSRRVGTIPVVGSGGRAGLHDTAMVRGPGITIGRAANLGVPTFVGEDFWPLNTTLFVRDFFGNNVKFVYYLFKILNLTGYDSGSVQPMLNRNYVRSIPIPVPHPEEQQAIAAVLAALDDKIVINERIVTCSLDIARAQFRYSFDSGQAAIRQIGELAELFDGPHATPTKTDTGPWFLSIASLQDGVLDLDESAHLSTEDFARWTRRVTPSGGDILFSYETRLGSAALMLSKVQACLGRRMALMRPRSGVIGSATLLHAYLSREFQDQINRKAVHGATVDRIPLTELPSWEIDLPACNRWPELETTLAPLHASIAAHRLESRALAELRDTLLPKLMSGELRIKDAERQVADAV